MKDLEDNMKTNDRKNSTDKKNWRQLFNFEIKLLNGISQYRIFKILIVFTYVIIVIFLLQLVLGD